jgi:hypothetical protein
LIVSAETDEQRLYRTRLRMRTEMRRALACMTAVAKRKLAKEWKETYSDLMYQELLLCARDRESCREIADWDLDNFGGKRK